MDIATSFRRISPDFSGLLGTIGEGTLHAAAFIFTGPDDVAQWLRQAGPVVGWSVLWGIDSTVWVRARPTVLVLDGSRPGDGEFHAPGEDGASPLSLKVRHLGSTWRCTAYAQASEALHQLGAPATRTTLAGVWQPRHYMVDPRFELCPPSQMAQADYRIWWTDDAVAGFAPVADVFMGFTIGPQEGGEADDE